MAAAGAPFLVYWTCLRVFTTVGNARAQSVLATANAALQECAMQLADAQVRQSFLQTVAVNRNLLAAAQAAQLPTYLA